TLSIAAALLLVASASISVTWIRSESKRADEAVLLAEGKQAEAEKAREAAVAAEGRAKQSEKAAIDSKLQAEDSARRALVQEELATQRARLAQSTFMSFQSQANLTRFPQLSALLAVEAVRVVAPDRDSNAESALRKVLSSIGGRGLGL